MPVCYFNVIGPSDACIYEYGKILDASSVSSPISQQQQMPANLAANASPLSTSGGGGGGGGSMGGITYNQIPLETLHLSRQFMTHSALDLVEDVMWTKPEFYLTKVDKFDDNKYYISAYVGFSQVKLLLMQDTEPHDNVRPFFSEAYELIAKYLLNPFVSPTQPIRNREFEERMVQVYNRHF